MFKKILFLIVFLLVSVCISAQTKPHWLQIQGSPVKDVRSFGVVGDGVTDDYDALKAAFESGGCIVMPAGLDISVDAPDGFADEIDVSSDTTIINFGSTITQQSDSGKYASQILRFNVLNDDTHLVLEGLRVSGASVSGMGISVYAAPGIVGGNVSISNCRVGSMNSLTRAESSSGISVQGGFYNVTITNNFIYDIYRTTDLASVGSASATGIRVTEGLGAVYVSNNFIKNILSNATVSWYDADGIFVSATSATTDPTVLHTVEVSNNYIEEFSGRAVKSQSPGSVVRNNTFVLNSGTQTNDSVLVDIQTGRGQVLDNVAHIRSGVTVGGSQCLVGLQGRYAGDRSLSVRGNQFFSEVPTLAYGVVISSTGEADTTFDISNNNFSGNIVSTVYTNIATSTHTGASSTVVVVDNNQLTDSTISRHLVYPTGDYFTDATRPLTFTWVITNNTITTKSTTHNGGSIIRDNASLTRVGYTKISGNSGWASGAKFKSASLLYILPGSDFYFDGNASCSFDSTLMASTTLGYTKLYIKRGQDYTELQGSGASATLKVHGYTPVNNTASWSWSTPYP